MARDTDPRGMYRIVAALGVTLGPMFIFVLPTFLDPHPYESPAEGLAAMADTPAAVVYGGFALQLLGAVFVVPAVFGIVYVLLRRRKAVRLGHVGAGLALIGSFSAMATIGMELAQARVLYVGEDRQAMVDLAVAIQSGAVFGSLLFATLVGLFVGMSLLVVCLWRAGVVPVWPLAWFVVPIALGLAPLPGGLTAVLVPITLLVPFVWISWAMLRTSEAPIRVPAVRRMA
jgi:hypothetical protein